MITANKNLRSVLWNTWISSKKKLTSPGYDAQQLRIVTKASRGDIIVDKIALPGPDHFASKLSFEIKDREIKTAQRMGWTTLQMKCNQLRKALSCVFDLLLQSSRLWKRSITSIYEDATFIFVNHSSIPSKIFVISQTPIKKKTQTYVKIIRFLKKKFFFPALINKQE